MTNMCKLQFEICVHVHDENADDLGKDLAKWLEESWFNGEDVVKIEYTGYDVVL